MKKVSKKGTIFACAVLGCCIALVACSPRIQNAGPDDSTPDGESGVIQVEWSMDVDCTLCHSEEAASMGNAELLASGHSSIKCAMCHTEAAIALSHEGVTTAPDEEQAKAMRKASRSMGTEDFCLRCHDSLDELARKSSDVTVVQDAHGTIVNPHAIPQNADHESKGVQQCFNCHRLHSKSPSPVTNCSSCHHQDVFECGTCHSIE